MGIPDSTFPENALVAVAEVSRVSTAAQVTRQAFGKETPMPVHCGRGVAFDQRRDNATMCANFSEIRATNLDGYLKDYTLSVQDKINGFGGPHLGREHEGRHNGGPRKSRDNSGLGIASKRSSLA
jgi:hypothetical protein